MAAAVRPSSAILAGPLGPTALGLALAPVTSPLVAVSLRAAPTTASPEPAAAG